MKQLTGRTRHRNSLFGKLILQVELAELYWSAQYAEYKLLNGNINNTWRDAKISDLNSATTIDSVSHIPPK